MKERISGLLVGICSLFSLSCAPASLVEMDTPSTVVDPSVIATRSGALQLYRQAVGVFSIAYGGSGVEETFGGHVLISGLFADEMMYGTSWGLVAWGVDERILEDFSRVNGIYQRSRVAAQQGREALRRYYPDGSQALQGRLQSLEAYMILFMAEVYCSGVPLTQVPLVGSPTLTRGFSTSELFEHALVRFDSAIALSVDSTRFVHLARVGKARTLLNLGRFEEARAVARTVPQDFRYEVEYGLPEFQLNPIGRDARVVQIVDRKGENGLIWSPDPRVAVRVLPDIPGGMRVTAKYSRTSAGTLDPTISAPATPIRLADGLEARLIEAEADLALGQASWLSILQGLRTACIGTAPCAPLPELSSTNLPADALIDPGTPEERLNLLMQERAMWLFATGHRQGDLRRMVKLYHRSAAALWPKGAYTHPGLPSDYSPVSTSGIPYGDRYVFDYGPDGDNPLYKGCSSMDPNS